MKRQKSSGSASIKDDIHEEANLDIGLRLYPSDLKNKELEGRIDARIDELGKRHELPFRIDLGDKDIKEGLGIDLRAPFWTNEKGGLVEAREYIRGKVKEALIKYEELDKDYEKLSGRPSLNFTAEERALFGAEPYLEESDGHIRVGYTEKSSVVYTNEETLNNLREINRVLGEKINCSTLKPGYLDRLRNIRFLDASMKDSSGREYARVRYNPGEIGSIDVYYEDRIYEFSNAGYGTLKRVCKTSRDGHRTSLPGEVNKPLPEEVRNARKDFIQGRGEITAYSVQLQVGTWTVELSEKETVLKTKHGPTFVELKKYNIRGEEIPFTPEGGVYEDINKFHFRPGEEGITVSNTARRLNVESELVVRETT